MNVLIIGSGKGSWQMRGLQLGAALGARVTSEPTDADWHWAERVLLVKHASPKYAARAHALSVPVIWDPLDFWKQPDENVLSSIDARERLYRARDVIKPTLTIGATEAMAAVVDGVCLPHHGYVGLVPTPARETARVVGYDGNGAYLAQWAPALTTACAARGWTFVINPPSLADVDIIVALRGGAWDGWMCREWKSGVKLSNAILAGRPVITQDTAAWREMQPAGSVVRTYAELPGVFDQWAPVAVRQEVVAIAQLRAPAFTAEAIATTYRALLRRVGTPAEVAC